MAMRPEWRLSGFFVVVSTLFFLILAAIAAAAPSIGSVILNSTFGLNTTTENLTAWPQSVSGTNNTIFDWRRNGTSIALVNMNFDVNDSAGTNKTKDYTTSGNNGTAYNITWNATGGWNGTGAYQFRSGNISMPDADPLEFNKSFSITLWMKPDSISDKAVSYVVTKGGSSGSGFRLGYVGTDAATCGGKDGTIFIWDGTNLFCSQNNLSASGWGFIAVTYNGSNTTIYINGTYENSSTSLSYSANAYNILFGMRGDGLLPYNGSIDNVMVFNRSLSAQEILTLYNNRTDLMVGQELGVRNNWSVCVTPNNGTGDGTTVCSNNVTIANTIPNVTLNSPGNFSTNRGSNVTLSILVGDANDNQNINVTFINATDNRIIGSVNNTAAGNVLFNWTNRMNNTQYSWCVNVTDSINTTSTCGTPWNFTTAPVFYTNCPDDSGFWNITSNYTLNWSVNCSVITVTNTSVLFINSTGASNTIINITAVNLSIDPGSSINGTAKGYRGSAGPGGGKNETTGNYGGGGASHAGIGGISQVALAGQAYGNTTWPTIPGSGGGWGHWFGGVSNAAGGYGGAALFLRINNTLNNSGFIAADGGNGSYDVSGGGGGGSGGSIIINTTTLTGNGSITADGGNGTSNPYGGGGGGGRIAIYYTTNSFTGTVRAKGSGGNQVGGAGTVYLKDMSTGEDTLLVNNWNIFNVSRGETIAYTVVNDTMSFMYVNLTNCSITGPALTVTKTYTTASGSVYINQTINANNTLLNAGTTTSMALPLNATILTVNGNLTHYQNNASQQYTLNITAINATITSGGSIDVSNKGYWGGQGPGNGTNTTTGNQGGGGGSHAGWGGRASATATRNYTYDDIANPVQLGSGGGWGHYDGSKLLTPGGSGGGLLTLNVSDTLTNNGTINASGQNGTNDGSGSSGGGSGGSIIINTTTLAGNGTITANGGNGGTTSPVGGGGGGGRIAIQYATTTYIGNITNTGGAGYEVGGAGTTYIKDKSTGKDTLIINNRNLFNSTIAQASAYTGLNGTTTFTTANFSNCSVIGSTLTVTDTYTTVSGTVFTNMTINANNAVLLAGTTTSMGQPLNTTILTVSGNLTHYTNNASQQYTLNITAINATITSGGSIDVSNKGYWGGQGPGNGTNTTTSNQGGGGGSHAGYGGKAAATATRAYTYGEITNPVQFGSGGGWGHYDGSKLLTPGGSGGGLLTLNVSDTLTNNGTINASGQNGTNDGSGSSGGGSGGSIIINTTTLAGNGTITANGGYGGTTSPTGGGGSGGRIAIQYTTTTYIGNITNTGGAGYEAGGAGTVYTKDKSTGKDALIINNKNLSLTMPTTINTTLTYTFMNLTNTTVLSNPLTVTDTITILPGVVALNSFVASAGNVIVKNGANLTHTANTNVVTYLLNITATNITVEQGGIVTADAKGYNSTNGPGLGNESRITNTGGSGASHGGMGALAASGANATVYYDDLTMPTQPGSGGGQGHWDGSKFVMPGGSGGGTILLNVSGTLNNTGIITANGQTGPGDSYGSAGGGSGGSIWIIANSIVGSGNISASGGNGGTTGNTGGGGGGGRISLNYQANTLTGRYNTSAGTGYQNGTAGTLFNCSYTTGFSCPGTYSGVVLSTLFDRNYTVNITRELYGAWNSSYVQWNETSTFNQTNGTYNATGLRSIALFYIKVNGTLLNTTWTNGSGTLYNFNVTLNNEKWIVLQANDAPTIASVILNSTNGTNKTSENLTAYPQGISDAEGDNISIVYDWRVNGTSIAVLNMNFDVNNSAGTNKTRDYTTSGNNGTVFNTTWNATGGYNGTGAYSFIGSNSSITIPSTLSGTRSVLFWVKFNALGQMGVIGTDASGYNTYDTMIGLNDVNVCPSQANKITVESQYPPTNSNCLASTNTVSAGTWYLVAVTTDGSYKRLYLNGVENNSVAFTGTLFGTENLHIGWGSNYYRYLNGTVDNVQVFNRSLSAQEISALYNNRTDRMVSQELALGNWSTCVTPNDGLTDGSTVCSNNVTIVSNYPPTIASVILNSTNGTNKTSENLTAYPQGISDVEGNNISICYDWRLNGTSIAVLNMNFDVNNSAGSGKTKDYSTSTNNGTNNGATWNATGGWNGTGAYTFNGTSGYIDIGNSASVRITGSLTLATWVRLDSIPTGGTAADLISKVENGAYGIIANEASSNAMETYFYIAGSYRIVGFPLSQMSAGSWYHVAATFNGSNVSIYLNGVLKNSTAVSGTISDVAAYNLTLGANPGTVYSEYLNGSLDNVLVLNRSLSPQEILALYNNQTNRVVSQEIVVGNNWSVCVTPNDGIDDGNMVCSNNVTIVSNYPPAISSVILNSTRGRNTTNENLTAYPQNVNDVEGNNISICYDWRLNGTSIAVLNMNFDVNNSAGSGKTLDYSTSNNNGTNNGATWNATGGWNGTGAYYFNGSTNITIPSATSLNVINTNWSFAAWVKPTNGNDDMVLIQQTDGTSTGRTFLGTDFPDGDCAGTSTPDDFYTYVGGTTFCSNTSAINNTWSLVAITVQENGTSDLIRFYVNGTQTATQTADSGTNDNAILLLGVHKTGQWDYTGYLDSLIIYNRTLTAAEVNALYNNQTNLMVSQELAVGNNWSVCATPNDGLQDGSTVCSNSVNITVPTIECTVDGDCAAGKKCYYDHCFSSTGLFILRNATQNVSWIDTYGRMMIAGTKSESQGSCSAGANGGLPITNASGTVVASIDSFGNLCTMGNVTQSAGGSLNAPTGGGIIVRNATGGNVATFAKNGSIVLVADLITQGFVSS